MDDLIRDIFNPKFVHYSRVAAEELDPLLRLATARLAGHIDEAIFGWCASMNGECECRADDSSTVRDIYVEAMEPIIGAQTVRVDIWVEDIDETSCVYGFLCSSEDGNVPYARGERTVVKVDPQSHRPSPWSAPFRVRQAELMKDLPAYA